MTEMDTPLDTPLEITDWPFSTPRRPVADTQPTQAYSREMLHFKIAFSPCGRHFFSIEDQTGQRFWIGPSDGPGPGTATWGNDSQ